MSKTGWLFLIKPLKAFDKITLIYILSEPVKNSFLKKLVQSFLYI